MANVINQLMPEYSLEGAPAYRYVWEHILDLRKELARLSREIQREVGEESGRLNGGAAYSLALERLAIAVDERTKALAKAISNPACYMPAKEFPAVYNAMTAMYIRVKGRANAAVSAYTRIANKAARETAQSDSHVIEAEDEEGAITAEAVLSAKDTDLPMDALEVGPAMARRQWTAVLERALKTLQPGKMRLLWYATKTDAETAQSYMYVMSKVLGWRRKSGSRQSRSGYATTILPAVDGTTGNSGFLLRVVRDAALGEPTEVKGWTSVSGSQD